ncbi:MAG: hypothetical protein M3511_08350, partial [Deinococcota bacterium]|nr:hypothetical protein [Deinococcota bacterium]
VWSNTTSHTIGPRKASACEICCAKFSPSIRIASNPQGRATFTMFLDHYAQVPKNIQDELTKR